MADPFGKIAKPYWDDKPVAVIGGGPSLLGFDFERLRGAHVLAVKRKVFEIPWADAGFGVNMERYIEWRDRLAGVQSRVYWAVPEDQIGGIAYPSKNITLLKRLDGLGVSENPSEIYGGGTSTFGALQVCIHKRAKEIVLFGFDYDGNYDGGFLNFGEKQRAQSAGHWAEWAEHFSIYVPHLRSRGVSIVNACPTSAIRCFQKVTLQDGVSMLRQRVAA